jgi:hypothetical protein
MPNRRAEDHLRSAKTDKKNKKASKKNIKK